MERPYKILVYLFKGMVLYAVSIATLIILDMDLHAPFSEQWVRYLISIGLVSLTTYYLRRDFNEYLD